MQYEVPQTLGLHMNSIEGLEDPFTLLCFSSIRKGWEYFFKLNKLMVM
jgi:hypothetical protein